MTAHLVVLGVGSFGCMLRLLRPDRHAVGHLAGLVVMAVAMAGHGVAPAALAAAPVAAWHARASGSGHAEAGDALAMAGATLLAVWDPAVGGSHHGAGTPTGPAAPAAVAVVVAVVAWSVWRAASLIRPPAEPGPTRCSRSRLARSGSVLLVTGVAAMALV